MTGRSAMPSKLHAELWKEKEYKRMQSSRIESYLWLPLAAGLGMRTLTSSKGLAPPPGEVSRVTSFDRLLLRRIAPHEEYPHKRRY
eukprot:scaffold5526_cov114-Skeletonema_marinoi.AAC.1